MSYEFEEERGIRARSYRFALLIIRLVRKLPRDVAGRELGGQLIRAGTGVGANVEEALGGLSRKEFAHGMNVAKKEARESAYWLRLIRDAKLLTDPELPGACLEATELTKMLTSIVKTTQESPIQPSTPVPRRVPRAILRNS